MLHAHASELQHARKIAKTAIGTFGGLGFEIKLTLEHCFSYVKQTLSHKV